VKNRFLFNNYWENVAYSNFIITILVFNVYFFLYFKTRIVPLKFVVTSFRFFNCLVYKKINFFLHLQLFKVFIILSIVLFNSKNVGLKRNLSLSLFMTTILHFIDQEYYFEH
jgi:hypothetical protein